MHYCCFVFTKEFPTDDVLYKVLKPFNSEKFYENEEENREYPEFMWDWYKVGSRYSGELKLEVRKNDEKYRWEFYENSPRNNRLFRSQLIDTIDKFRKTSRDGWMFSEENVFSELGYADGYIRVDACPVSDILNREELNCYCFVDKNGNAFSNEWWNGEKYEQREHFTVNFEKAMKDSQDCYLCVVDLHD